MNPSGAKHAPSSHQEPNNIQQRASLPTAKLPHQDQLGGAPAQTEIIFISAPTYRDVLNGRGQGVQRHPGNVKYRALVYVNKVRQTMSSVHINYQLHSLPPASRKRGIVSQHRLSNNSIFYFHSQGLYAKCPRNDKLKISKVGYFIPLWYCTSIFPPLMSEDEGGGGGGDSTPVLCGWNKNPHNITTHFPA